WGSVLGRLFPQGGSAWSGARDAALPGQEKRGGAVRTGGDQVLELWVEVAGAASGVGGCPGAPTEVLLAHLLNDRGGPAEGIKLKADTKPSAPKRPKLGGGGDAPPLHRKLEPAANRGGCQAALRGTGGAGPPRGRGGLHPSLGTLPPW
ncbi:PELP1 protein, partial [Rostratula benghalensis]|nr:PELP1 protein [Rostratula benghalensis]